MKKAYLVELKIYAVVMADNGIEAMGVAECEAADIVRDGELEAASVTEVKSLECLQSLNSGWDEECIPYGGDGNTRLRELLLNQTSNESEGFNDV